MRISLHKLILIAVLTLSGLPIAGSLASAQTPGNIAVQSSGITYYAQAGDTLMTIAQRLTTRNANWVTLGKVNQINKDSNIPIGTAIFIPAELLADEASEATVIARNGAITATSASGDPISLDIGSKITEGMKINTGLNSFLTLSLADESRISLPSNSSVLVAKLRKSLYTGSPRTELKLLRGRIVSRVSPLNINKGLFEVHTPLSVAGVRGTRFRVSLNNQKVTTEVLDGQVAVGSLRTPEALALPAAKGNLITRETIGPAIDLLPPPQFSSTPYRQGGAAKFVIAPLADARAYHVQIAQDADMLHMLAEGSSNGSEVVINNIQEGEYFIRVAAIDKSGLEGIPRTVAVNIRNRNEAAPVQAAPSVINGGPKELVLRWPGSADQKYNVQVARDSEFSWLLFTNSVAGNEIRLPRPSFGTYFARVQSINADGSTNPFSFVQTLIVTDQWIINDGHPLHPKEVSRSATR
ncbi:FecR domain-containing protein [Herminiimonas fonticola]|uniref:FecR domain-containing protein n=1 Tax=Herminiimonas fonticola TaxID=303380 RepID=UPI00333F69E6